MIFLRHFYVIITFYDSNNNSVITYNYMHYYIIFVIPVITSL